MFCQNICCCMEQTNIKQEFLVVIKGIQFQLLITNVIINNNNNKLRLDRQAILLIKFVSQGCIVLCTFL